MNCCGALRVNSEMLGCLRSMRRTLRRLGVIIDASNASIASKLLFSSVIGRQYDRDNIIRKQFRLLFTNDGTRNDRPPGTVQCVDILTRVH